MSNMALWVTILAFSFLDSFFVTKNGFICLFLSSLRSSFLFWFEDFRLVLLNLSSNEFYLFEQKIVNKNATILSLFIVRI